MRVGRRGQPKRVWLAIKANQEREPQEDVMDVDVLLV